jgi:hypothetical protein
MISKQLKRTWADAMFITLQQAFKMRNIQLDFKKFSTFWAFIDIKART